MTTDAIINIDALGKRYRDGLFKRRIIKALNEVSFSINKGEIFGLLGPNGAGKTTLIKILLGIVKKTSGKADVFGKQAGTISIRKKIGYLPENHRIPQHLTANTALEYYGSLSGLSYREIKSIRPKLLDQVGLKDWGTTSVQKFSKGMLQRLGLAQAMIHDPELIILDEPTDGVDPVGRADIRVILKNLKAEGKTVFLNSHLLQEVELVSDRVAIMDRGVLQRVGNISELTDNGSKVRFLLCGEKTDIESALGEHETQLWKQLPENRYSVEVSIPEMTDIDQIIDKLRAKQISIRLIEKCQSTLEQAFIEIIKKNSN